MIRLLTALLVAVVVSGCAARSSAIVAEKAVVAAAHAEPVCMMRSPMPSNIKHRIVGEVHSSKQWYGSQNELLPVMAQEARKMGADAVVNLATSHKVGALAWARPVGSGTAIKLDDRGDLNCVALGGELR